MTLVFPRREAEAQAFLDANPDVEAVHHYLLNRGVIITPFHNMMLICPATTAAHVERLVDGLDRCLADLMG